MFRAVDLEVQENTALDRVTSGLDQLERQARASVPPGVSDELRRRRLQQRRLQQVRDVLLQP